MLKKLWNNTTKYLILTIVVIFVGYFVSVTAAFFWTIFLAFIFFNLDSKVIAQAALMCLVMLPILLATGKEGPAEQVAVYAYYLLAMTVILQIIELKRSSKADDEETQYEKPRAPLPFAVQEIKKARRMVIDIIPKRTRGKLVRRKDIEDHD